LSQLDPALVAALGAQAPLPSDAGGPVFAEPWQAQAFALTCALHAKGLFSWTEWALALSTEIAEHLEHGGCTDGSDYYERWAEALQHLLVAKGHSSHQSIDAMSAAWARAAEATPHGQPILLENDPQALPV
jgi:nitrile hydratase accessory protein